VDLRRIALAVIPALGVVLTSGVSAAQQVAKVPRVGYLPSASVGPTPTTPNRLFEAFRKGLGDLGYIEGRDIVIEPRWAEGRVERLPELAAELVGLKVDIIATTGAVAARAAKNATTTIPVVMAVVIDPVAGGLVSNLQRPGGNVTGLTTYDPQQPRKQIEILKEVIPGLARLALLGDQDVRAGLLRANEEQARALGLQTQSYLVGAPDPDLEGAFDASAAPFVAADRRTCGQASAADTVREGLCRCRGPDCLWSEPCRGRTAHVGIRGQDHQGSGAGRPAHRGGYAT
jgi:putative tryptophan/tyrosine transport system substrate-binding protein